MLFAAFAGDDAVESQGMYECRASTGDETASHTTLAVFVP